MLPKQVDNHRRDTCYLWGLRFCEASSLKESLTLLNLFCSTKSHKNLMWNFYLQIFFMLFISWNHIFWSSDWLRISFYLIIFYCCCKLFNRQSSASFFKWSDVPSHHSKCWFSSRLHCFTSAFNHVYWQLEVFLTGQLSAWMFWWHCPAVSSSRSTVWSWLCFKIIYQMV